MSKLLKLISLVLIAISTANAVDIAIDYDKSKSIKKDKTLSISNQNTTTKTKQKAHSNSVSTTIDLSLFLVNRLDYSCINNPRTLNSFGLGYMDSGIIDLNKKEFLVNAGINSLYLDDAGISDVAVKAYMTCLVKAGAKLAQASLNFSNFSKAEMTEKEFENALERSIKKADKISSFKIKMMKKQALESIKRKCHFFNNSENIMCGNVSLEMSSVASNKVSFLNHVLFGDSVNNFGISTKYEIAISENNNNDIVVIKTEESTQSKSTSLSKSKTDKKSLSGGKFMPGL